MSRSIDQRIVEMRFDNAQFERGVKDTTSLLDRLKEALRLDGGKKGLDEVQAAADNFSMNGMAAGIDNISSKFNALGAIGFSILQDLTRRAIDFGTNLVRNTLDPILSGGRRRAMNLEQANFQFEGLGMDAEKAMESALYAVEGTAFGLDEAAVLAANFGATGMEAGQEMADALKGVSGVAAMAGASYAEIGDVFGKVAGQGRLMGDDLNRLASRGVNAAATMADQMGITESEFRDMVSQGEITFQMFAEGMNEAFGEHATKANDTYTGSLSNMRAALARVGASFFTPHLTRSRDLFNALTPLIDRVNEALGPLIENFSEFLDMRYEGLIDFLNMLDDDSTGGRVLASSMQLIETSAKTLMTWLRPIAAAFADIFGGATIDGVVALVDGFTSFVESFSLSASQAENLQRTFAGIFAIFDIGFHIIGEVIAMIADVVAHLFEGTDGFLALTGGVGDSIVAFRDMIKEGDAVSTILGFIGDALKNVIDFFRNAIDVVAAFFGGLEFGELNFDWLGTSAETVLNSLTPLASLGQLASIAWSGFLNVLGWIWDLLEPIGEAVVDWARDFGPNLADVIRDTDWNLVLDAINTGLLAGFFLLIRDFFKGLGDSEEGGGLIDAIKDIFGGLTDSLEDLQNNLKADTLMKIAGAIAILTLSVIGLSMVDPAALTKSLAAITVMFTQLMGAMAIFSKLAVGPGLLRLPMMAAGLVLLAGALALLTVPVIALSTLDWDELARGLAGLAGVLLLITPVASILSGTSGSFIRIGLALVPFAAGIAILSASVKSMSGLDWDEIARGLTTLAGVLAGVVLAMTLMPSSAVMRKGVSLAILAAGINLLAEPIERMSKLTWGEVGRGLTTLGGALGIMAVGLMAMSGTMMGAVSLAVAAASLNLLIDPLERMSRLGWDEIGKAMTTLGGSLAILAGGLYLLTFGPVGAASLVVAAAGLMMLIDPLERMGQMQWDEIGRAMTVLGGSLAILAGGLFLMTGSIVGAAALVVATFALWGLVPVLTALGDMQWDEILRGLTALAGVFAVIGVAGLLLTPVIPSLILLGGALVLIGGGMMIGGAGMLAFGAGLTAVGVAIATNGVLMIEFLTNLITLVPQLATALANALADFIITFVSRSGEVIMAVGQLVSDILTEIQLRTPEFRETFVTIMLNILTAIQELAPEIKDTLVIVISEALEGVRQLAPEFAETGMLLLHTFLDTIEENLDSVIEKGTRIVEKLIEGILQHFFGLDQAGVDSVMEFLGGVQSLFGTVLTEGSKILSNLIDGIEGGFGRLPGRGKKAVSEFIAGLQQKWEDLKKEGGRVLGEVGQGIIDAIPGWVSSIASEAASIGGSIIDGIRNGISGGVGRIEGAARSAARSAFEAAKNFLDINSPSRKFMELGKDIDDGLALGIDRYSNTVAKSSENVAKKSLGTVEEALSYLPSMFDGMTDTQPVIRPVLDLTEVERDAGMMGSIFGNPNLGGSYGRAKSIAGDYEEMRRIAEELQQAEQQRPASIVLNQNNTSPKALSETEIYRQTKNLLSTTKEVIKT